MTMNRAGCQNPIDLGQDKRIGLRVAPIEQPAITASEVLASLPKRALVEIEPLLSLVTFEASAIIQAGGEAIEKVYFPTSGLASLQVVVGKNSAIDTALIGRDSIIGPAAIIADARTRCRCIARSVMVAWRISASDLRAAAENNHEILAACFDYSERLLSQTQISAARYAAYPVGIRLALCLMEASNLLGSKILPLSQETLSEMLNVRRTSITKAACDLKLAGAIEYSRGTITIINRSILFKQSRL